MCAQTGKEVMHMKKKCGVKQFEAACRRNAVPSLLDKYIRSCRPREEGADPASPAKKGAAPDRFPNLAGFCRFSGITPEDLEELSVNFPEQIHGLYAALEDEALNSSLPAAILSVYLKKRLGYEDGRSDADPTPIQICFEHDVMRDGE